MYPVQPLLAISSDRYYKRMTNNPDIVHIYAFRYRGTLLGDISVIPDDCIDVTFDLDNGCNARIGGTVMSAVDAMGRKNFILGHLYFGARFRPGVVPTFVDGIEKEFVGHSYLLEECTPYAADLKNVIAEAKSFPQAADAFERFYNHIVSEEKTRNSTSSLLIHGIETIVESVSGNCTMDELVRESGYSKRYIEQVFKDVKGISPKTFGRIVRFQDTIRHFNQNLEISLANLSLSYGYYDQSQMNHEFKQMSGVTPNKYRKQIQSSRYGENFIFE